MRTPLEYLGRESANELWIKREDLFPFTFGGNKARIAAAYFEEIAAAGCDCVVTYGGRASNLCRAVAMMAAQREMPCVTVMHDQGEIGTYNERLTRLSGARTVVCPVEKVAETIEAETDRLRQAGRRPFFIPGGGQGNPGVGAYAACYEEIMAFTRETGVAFDYVFVPCGTGTTQAGLICGKLLHGGGPRIVGMSVARTAERAEEVIRRCVGAYCGSAGVSLSDDEIGTAVTVEDAYREGGYGRGDHTALIGRIWRRYAVPLDNTYTAKAFAGMERYLTDRGVAGKTVLFLHTGATPLFFDDLPEEPFRKKEDLP